MNEIKEIVKKKYAGADWIKSNLAFVRPDMVVSELGCKVADILGQVFQGIYHMEDKHLFKADWDATYVISVTTPDNGFATYDYGLLTHLVLLAHAAGLRVAITASTHGYLKITFMVVSEYTTMGTHHPTLRESIERYFSDVNFVMR